MKIKHFLENYKQPDKQPINHEDDGILSAGICDTCKQSKMTNIGNGIDEPFDTILFCDKMFREICPELPKNRMITCEFYIEI